MNEQSQYQHRGIRDWSHGAIIDLLEFIRVHLYISNKL